MLTGASNECNLKGCQLLALRARVAELEELTKECADDLEAMFQHRYRLNDGTIHPGQQRDFDCDMDLVVRARAALAHDHALTKKAPVVMPDTRAFPERSNANR